VRLGSIRQTPGLAQDILEVLESNIRKHQPNNSAPGGHPAFALRQTPLYIGVMSEANPKSAVELELKRLEKRLEDLIVTVSHIKEENRALRQRQETLTTERATLLQKNEQVRARVEQMIGRLKSMEQA
jgi:cell division protein ZapB